MENQSVKTKTKSNGITIKTLKNGIKSGLNTTWTLAKIIVTVYFIITFVKYTPLLDWIAIKCAPLMKIFGLPGEAAIALVLGNVINLYAAIGAIASLSLTAKQSTIIAVMLSFSHSLFMESAVAKKTGISVVLVLLIRFSLAIISGILLNLIL
ncbi:nucleoside recognition domain-containing protein [Thermohalobacter berrensis]|uniref:Nucleoside recognition protein n=1 Tax=Thermohalobacter berrensis TaxID=99594 RepID=A0A419T5P2_9FIRM|nr:nucleoside recognition domain-containing protein [Thermohalobacter berrensis]RKD32718.1 nucleoside recognition protein [Thermohalobacter berrensis]